MTQVWNRDCMDVKRMRSGRKTKYKTRLLINCPSCHTQFKNSEGSGSLYCPDCGHRCDCRTVPYKDHPERIAKLNEWLSNPDNKKKHQLKTRTRERLVILKKVGRGVIACSNCGCDDVRLLEINHVNGGGTKETEKGKYVRQFHRAIFKDERSVEDLNILCKVCNIEHYVRLKFGISKFQIKYNADQ